MKFALLIGDGMADLPIGALGGQTPLAAARTPAMDALCRMGRAGRVKTVPDGLSVGSDTAILSIFGCNPVSCYTGRAPLEAAGMGLAVSPGETVFRANLVTVKGESFLSGSIASHAAGGIGDEEARALTDALQADPGFAALMALHGMRLVHGGGFRNIALFAKPVAITSRTAPPHDILERPLRTYLPDDPGDPASLAFLMEASHAFLSAHPVNAARAARGELPANALWLWGEGRAAALPGFEARYGARGAVVTAVPLVRGIARLCGLETPVVQGADGTLDTDYAGKVRTALHALEHDDFAAIHYEAPDECAHAGDLQGKLQGIERFDARIVAPILEGLKQLGEPFRILVMPDHPTPLSSRTHEGQFVPYVIAGAGIEASGAVPRMTEDSVASTPAVNPGTRLMDELMARP